MGADARLTATADGLTLALADFGFADADGDAFAGVVITTVPQQGSLSLDGTALSAGTFVHADHIARGDLVFTPAASAQGSDYASFTFQVKDDGPDGADTDATPNTITFDLPATNQAPAGSDKLVTLAEDTVHIFSAADFGFTDVDGDAFAGVVVTTLPAAGALSLDGAVVTAGQLVAIDDIAAGKLRFAPDADTNGAAYAAFTFQVQDASPTANLDPDANTITLKVTPANDAPTGAATGVLADGTEDVAYTVSVADLLAGFSDVDGDALSVAGLAADHGIVTINKEGGYRITPTADYNGPVTLTYTVVDGAGGATPATRTFTLAPVNDAPHDLSLSGGTVAENAAGGTLVGTVSGADVDAGDTLSYSLLDNAGGRFAVDAVTGRITVLEGSLLDFKTAAPHDLTVRTTDAAGATYHETFTVQVADVKETQTRALTTGADAFRAGSDDDWVIDGLRGNDTITTLGGDDVLHGNLGDDVISTGAGDDIVTFSGTKDGFDTVDGGAGTNDRVHALANNTIIGLKSVTGVETISANGHSGVKIVGSAGGDTLDFSGVELLNIVSLDGASGHDTIRGSQADDVIIGGAGDDALFGEGGDDTFVLASKSGLDSIDGGAGVNTVRAGAADAVLTWSNIANVQAVSNVAFNNPALAHDNFRIAGTLGGDTIDLTGVTLTGVAAIDGGSGDDTITGSAGDDTIIGGTGDDTLAGGDGDDTFLVAAKTGKDRIDGGAGYDTVRASSANVSLAWGDYTAVEAYSGGGFANAKIVGTSGADTIDLAGVTLVGIARVEGGLGADTITGSAGADTLLGGAGADLLRGGAGADVFDFDLLSDSYRTTTDGIADFELGSDRIDLSTIDANARTAGDQAFAFIGAAAFSGAAGQLRYDVVAGAVQVSVDVDGNGSADMAFRLLGLTGLDAGDFIL